MLLHCVDRDAEVDATGSAEIEGSMTAWLEDTITRGISLHGGRLQPAGAASTVRVREGELLVSDGPFAETKEQIAGYDVIECADLDEAIELVSRLPVRFGSIEIRPFVAGDEALPRRPLQVAAWAEAMNRAGAQPNPAPTRSTAPAPERRESRRKKYMFLVCVDEAVELSPEDVAESDRRMSAWLEDTIGSGVSLHGGRLQPVSTATTVRARAGELLVTDGPFAETKEQMAGYDVIECADLDEAVEVASRHPVARFGCIEVRPFTDQEQALPRRPLDVPEWARAIASKHAG
jgi:hypothetical protein